MLKQMLRIVLVHNLNVKLKKSWTEIKEHVSVGNKNVIEIKRDTKLWL